MRVILDSNVLFSALLSPRGHADQVYRSWQDQTFDLVTSVVQIEEIRRASRYPKFKDILQPHRVGNMVAHLRHSILLTELPALPNDLEIADPADLFLLAMAMGSQADYLVTGDRRSGLLGLGHWGRTRIVSLSAFCTEVL